MYWIIIIFSKKTLNDKDHDYDSCDDGVEPEQVEEVLYEEVEENLYEDDFDEEVEKNKGFHDYFLQYILN